MEIDGHRRFLGFFLKEQYVLKSYLLVSTGSMEEAEELFQEVSSVLWTRFDRYDESRPFRAWALGVARLEVLKWRERQGRRPAVLSEDVIESLAETAGALAPEADERRAKLEDCMRRLPPAMRDVLARRYLDALPPARLAEAVGKSLEAIEMALVRARRALHDCVDRKLRESALEA